MGKVVLVVPYSSILTNIPFRSCSGTDTILGCLVRAASEVTQAMAQPTSCKIDQECDLMRSALTSVMRAPSRRHGRQDRRYAFEAAVQCAPLDLPDHPAARLVRGLVMEWMAKIVYGVIGTSVATSRTPETLSRPDAHAAGSGRRRRQFSGRDFVVEEPGQELQHFRCRCLGGPGYPLTCPSVTKGINSTTQPSRM